MKAALGDIVTTKKPHPCGSSRWEVVRTGADGKIECLGCGHVGMLDLTAFEKAVKKVEKHAGDAR